MLFRRRPWLLLVVVCVPLSALGFPYFPDKASSPVTAPSSAPATSLADKLVVKKSERRLYLMRGDKPLRTYKIGLGYQPAGHKLRKGDGRTPEGRYFLDWRSANSAYRKALHISYPNGQDRMRARFKGDDPGGMIMIHGQPNGRDTPKTGDWTFGCIAVSNMAIDEIWSMTADGTPIDILP